MAERGERRMVFDIRGKRKHVVRVVYAILALLMGASLFLVVGPVNIGSLLGNSTTTANTTKVFEERAERLERKLRKSPHDEGLQLALIRTRLSAGQAAAANDARSGNPPGAGFEEAFKSLEEAGRVQQVYAEAKPTASSYTTLALFQLIAGNFKEGDKSGKKAESLASSKEQKKEVRKS